jgi:hypothetical protein
VNTRATLLLSALLLVAAGVAWLILGSGERGTSGRDAPAPAVAPAERSREPANELVPPGALEEPEPGAAPAKRVAEAESAPAAKPAGPWIVRVLRDGAPAAGVDVVWASAEALRALPQDGKGAGADFVERVTLAGSRGATDDAGELVVPPLAAGAGIAASDGTRLDFHTVRGDETPPIVLELVLDRALPVKVVDARGEPVARAKVLLDLMDGPVNQQWTETTRSDGLATFRHIGVGRPVGDGAAGSVSVVGTFDVPIEVPFRVADWPEETLVLVVPESGVVVVEVVDEEGRLCEKLTGEVVLVIEREQLPGAMLYNRPRETAELEGGRARFERVGLGLELGASFDGRPELAPVRATFRGPAGAGEEVVVRLVVGAPEAVLLFRALDASGKPLAGTEVEIATKRSTESGSSITTGGESLATDAEGRVHMPLLETWHEGTRLELEVTHESGLAASVDVSRGFPPGETDLGDVVLRAPEVLVAGRILDIEGKPISGAHVKVETHSDDADADALEWWTFLWDVSKEDGSFSFPDGTTASELRLVVSSPDFVEPEPVPVTRGQRDVVIVLERGGAVAGSIVPPEGLSPSAFQIQRGASASSNRAVGVEADGSFVARGLAPGSVDVSVWLVPGNVRLTEIPGVEVVDGETTRDPRLQGIDCRDLVTALRVRVRRSDGELADGGWVRILGAPGDEAGFLIESGEARVLGQRGPLDLEIAVPGHRLARRFDVRADLEVVLDPAFRVRLELAREVELPGESTQLQVRLTRTSGPDDVRPPESLGLFRGAERTGWWNRYFGNETNSFGASREVFVSVQEPGTYTVEFFLVMGDPNGGMMSTSLASSQGTLPLELDESDADATFRVAPDAESLAQAFGR